LQFGGGNSPQQGGHRELQHIPRYHTIWPRVQLCPADPIHVYRRLDSACPLKCRQLLLGGRSDLVATTTHACGQDQERQKIYVKRSGVPLAEQTSISNTVHVALPLNSSSPCAAPLNPLYTQPTGLCGELRCLMLNLHARQTCSHFSLSNLFSPHDDVDRKSNLNPRSISNTLHLTCVSYQSGCSTLLSVKQQSARADRRLHGKQGIAHPCSRHESCISTPSLCLYAIHLGRCRNASASPLFHCERELQDRHRMRPISRFWSIYFYNHGYPIYMAACLSGSIGPGTISRTLSHPIPNGGLRDNHSPRIFPDPPFFSYLFPCGTRRMLI